MTIKVGDIVYHQLSKLLFRCENNKHMRWMNMNPYYVLTNLKTIDYEQFEPGTKENTAANNNDQHKAN